MGRPAALPTATEAFRAAVKEVGHPPNAVEKGLQELPLEGPLPLAQRKAAYEVTSTMPGATVTAASRHAKGRPAVTVSVTTDAILDTYYFDATTFRLLEASFFATTASPGLPAGSGYQILYSDWTITPKA